MKIVAEENLAAMPKFVLEVKDGNILFFNERTRLADGWYWSCDTGPLIGPFESIDDAGEAAAIASDPGVAINAINTGGEIVEGPHDSPGGHRAIRMHAVEIKLAIDLALDELERRDLIYKTGEFRSGQPGYAVVDRELKELPEGLTLMQQQVFRIMQAEAHRMPFDYYHYQH
jgi:hypothetical protein